MFLSWTVAGERRQRRRKLERRRATDVRGCLHKELTGRGDRSSGHPWVSEEVPAEKCSGGEEGDGPQRDEPDARRQRLCSTRAIEISKGT